MELENEEDLAVALKTAKIEVPPEEIVRWLDGQRPRDVSEALAVASLLALDGVVNFLALNGPEVAITFNIVSHSLPKEAVVKAWSRGYRLVYDEKIDIEVDSMVFLKAVSRGMPVKSLLANRLFDDRHIEPCTSLLELRHTLDIGIINYPPSLEYLDIENGSYRVERYHGTSLNYCDRQHCSNGYIARDEIIYFGIDLRYMPNLKTLRVKSRAIILAAPYCVEFLNAGRCHEIHNLSELENLKKLDISIGYRIGYRMHPPILGRYGDSPLRGLRFLDTVIAKNYYNGLEMLHGASTIVSLDISFEDTLISDLFSHRRDSRSYSGPSIIYNLDLLVNLRNLNAKNNHMVNRCPPQVVNANFSGFCRARDLRNCTNLRNLTIDDMHKNEVDENPVLLPEGIFKLRVRGKTKIDKVPSTVKYIDADENHEVLKMIERRKRIYQEDPICIARCGIESVVPKPKRKRSQNSPAEE